MTNHNKVAPELFKKIKKELGVEQAQVYREIRKYTNEYNLEREFAAIKLASTLGISISKYASPEYYSAIRSNAPPTSTSPQGIDVQPVRNQKIRKIEVHPKVDVDISKVTNPELKEILTRDIKELNYAISSGFENMKKTSMVLSGSITESLLLESLTRNMTIEAQSIAVSRSLTENKPNKPNQPNTWVLATLIAVAQNLPTPLLPTDSLPQIGQLRKWRNLIHPGLELKESARNRIKPTKSRARNAVAFLQFISSELN